VRQVVPSILPHLRDLEELISERVCNRITRPRLLGPAVRPGAEPAAFRREIRPLSLWRVEETHVCVAGRWTYRYRAVDSIGHTNRCFSRSSHSTDFSRAAQAFLRVGDTREWILEYCAAAASDVHANPYQINLEDAGPITTFYPVTTLAPNSMPENPYLGTSCSMDI